MAKKMKPGKIAFMVGIFGSLLLGLLAGLGVFATTAILSTILIVAGLIIGYMNIADKDSVAVMVGALVIGAGAGVIASLPFVGEIASSMLASLATVIVPAGIVVAVKVLIAKSK